MGDPVLWRRRLHALAELSDREEATAAFVAGELAACGPDFLWTDLGGHGVLAGFGAPDAGGDPCILLRAELDALPIDETLDIDHASFTPGVSHKCGHDGHMAMLLGLAGRLRDEPPRRGRVLLLFQPAEETGRGAAAVLADARWSGLRCDWVFALHNLPGYPVGAVVAAPGSFCAASCGLILFLEGAVSHAAYPEQGHNPGPAMARLVLDLVNLPDGLDAGLGPGLVTVTHARLGEPAFGISPGRAEIRATLRAQTDAGLDALRRKSATCAARIAADAGLRHELAWAEEFPAVVNDARAAELVLRAADNLGLATASPGESPFRWSEDFGRLAVLGCGALFGLGCGRDHPALHAENYDFNDAILARGVELWREICRLVADGAAAGNKSQ